MLDHAPLRARQAIARLAGITCLGAVVFWGISWARKSDSSAFAVSGFSMAPTLLGETETWQCKTCGFTDRLACPVIPHSATPETVMPDSASSQPERCPQCAGELFPTGCFHPPDLLFPKKDCVKVQRGDLVAIEISRPAVKRVVAIPGDIVDRDGLRLTVNAKPIIHDASVLVYRNTGQGPSRWKRQGKWMTYHNANAYRGNAPSGVMDDYSINRTLSRTLYPVTDLYVTSASTGAPLRDIDIRIWRPGMENASDRPVTQTSPVAIPFPDWQSNHDIEIRRKVLYRLRPHDDQFDYPITLGPDEFFVLGDNVPISVDSRDFGPLKRGKITACLSQ